MALSVRKDFQGPIWPLGLIVVATPGTPVNIMSLVDPGLLNDPNNPATPVTIRPEYAVRAQQIMFQGVKAAGGTTSNSGNVYIMRRGGTLLSPPGGVSANNRTDYGTMVLALGAGLTFFLASAPLNRNVFSPYDYAIDADNAGDSCLVSLIIQ
jgi:hypothetical protein